MSDLRKPVDQDDQNTPSNPESPASTSHDIVKRREQLRHELRALLGWAATTCIPKEPDPAWTAKAIDLHKQLMQVEAEALDAFRRSDQKSLSAFVKGINSADGPSAEALRWWWNRY